MVEMRGALGQAFHGMFTRILWMSIFIGFLFIGSDKMSAVEASSKKQDKKNVPNKKKKNKKSKSSKSKVSSSSNVLVNPSRPPLSPVGIVQPQNDIMKASSAFTDLDLPTDNQMIFSKTDAAAFFQPTFSGRTLSASFGCVRDPGSRGLYTRFHEGVDIRPTLRDRKGEPEDEVHSAGTGKVVYLCGKSKDSNYGKYVVIEHDLFGSPFYTLYAHLSSIADGLGVGRVLEKGEKIGVLGRTSNEFEIDQNYAHLHFEVNLLANDRYVEWSKSKGEGIPKHQLYNGSNLIGINPISFFQFLQINPDLGIADFITREKVAFKVLVPFQTHFFWIQQYPFILTKPVSEKTYAYEIAMTHYGLPVYMIPRSRQEIASGALKALDKGIYPLTYANADELECQVCSQFIEHKGKYFRLSKKGAAWLKQLLYY